MTEKHYAGTIHVHVVAGSPDETLGLRGRLGEDLIIQPGFQDLDLIVGRGETRIVITFDLILETDAPSSEDEEIFFRRRAEENIKESLERVGEGLVTQFEVIEVHEVR